QRLANDISQQTGREISHLGRVHEGMRYDYHVEALVTLLWKARHSDTLHKDSLITLLIDRLWRLSALSISDKDPAKHTLDKNRLKRAVEYLHSQFLEPLSLKDIADVTGLSQYHFLRAFKESTGITPHAYLRRLRIIHGKQILERGSSCIDAAYTAGFADQAHFTRAFKTIYRMTPGQYIALCR
ncbi:MAG: AraC family transcriptional regulator, partial [Verrucomicrobiota bacterium]